MDRDILVSWYPGRSEAVKRGHVSPHPMIRMTDDPYLKVTYLTEYLPYLTYLTLVVLRNPT